MRLAFVHGRVGGLIWLQTLQITLAAGRALPLPAGDHPGNIFVADEEVSVRGSFGENANWRAVDYEGHTAATGRVINGEAKLGRLPVGYYELSGEAAFSSNRVSVGVLQELRAATPPTSPIGIDVAMAWFYPPEKMKTVANLCALAGINRVRDRLNWSEMEPKRGQFSLANRYDDSASAQSAAGLQVLQVIHLSPEWANPHTKRFPPDLRDIYAFERAMAQRWRHQVVAFEPWNEADIDAFGGHTGSEMASLQKAAYLGLKAGNPKVIACWNVLAIHRGSTLRDLQANEAWPYFDTFNFHHYEPFAAYPRLYADYRAVSAGKSMWVTECSLPVKWQGDPGPQEPTPEDLRTQSERVAITYALAIHEGAKAVFYFMLPHFVEGQTQFGIVHRDLTPRPAFVALAAVGRLLADAKPLGRLQTRQDALQGYLFAAKPDGARAKVLVIWSEHETSLELPGTPKAAWDHLGRALPVLGRTVRVTRAPKFVILAPRDCPALVEPPHGPELLPGRPSPIVLQAVLPEETILLEKSAYRIAAKQPVGIPIYAYNFGRKTVHGRLGVVSPKEWKVEFPNEIDLQSGERKELPLRLTCEETTAGTQTVRITGNFGSAGRASLSLQIQPATVHERDAGGPGTNPIVASTADLAFLRDLAREVVQAARVLPRTRVGGSPTNTCGFPLIMPGGRGGYPAFWVRDFAMSLESGFITPEEMLNHLRLVARCQNGPLARKLKHGLIVPPYSIPDHINFDGTAVFYPGTYLSGDDQGQGTYGILPPVDDHYEFVHMAYCLFRATGKTDFLQEKIAGTTLFEHLATAFAAPNSNLATGLVSTDTAQRAVGFGFCDAVCLTGDLLFPSLLRFRAAGQMAELSEATGHRARLPEYREVQRRISQSLVASFSDPQRIGGWLMAATKTGRQPDVWGTLYALRLGVIERSAAERALRTITEAVRKKTIVFEGAVRHVPTDLDFSEASAWEKTAGLRLNTYQNGAYWHTPTGWLIAAVRRRDPPLAAELFGDYIQHLRKNDFRLNHGPEAPWECFGPSHYAQNGVYMTSVTVPVAVMAGESPGLGRHP